MAPPNPAKRDAALRKAAKHDDYPTNPLFWLTDQKDWDRYGSWIKDLRSHRIPAWRGILDRVPASKKDEVIQQELWRDICTEGPWEAEDIRKLSPHIIFKAFHSDKIDGPAEAVNLGANLIKELKSSVDGVFQGTTSPLRPYITNIMKTSALI